MDQRSRDGPGSGSIGCWRWIRAFGIVTAAARRRARRGGRQRRSRLLHNPCGAPITPVGALSFVGVCQIGTVERGAGACRQGRRAASPSPAPHSALRAGGSHARRDRDGDVPAEGGRHRADADRTAALPARRRPRGAGDRARQGPDRHAGFPVERVLGLRWRLYPGLTLARPTPRLLAILARWQPDIVHLAGPVLLGAQGRSPGGSSACRWPRTSRPTWRPTPRTTAWPRSGRSPGTTCAPSTAWPTAPTARPRRSGVTSPRAASATWRSAPAASTRGGFLRRRDPALRARILGPGADPATPILAYVGRVSPEKNLEALVTIARARPDLPLLIVGDGPARPGLECALAGRRAHFTGELRGPALGAATPPPTSSPTPRSPRPTARWRRRRWPRPAGGRLPPSPAGLRDT